jgi:beta-glucanase (GH16 family)
MGLIRGAAMSRALRRAAKTGMAALMVLLTSPVPACGSGSTQESCDAGDIATPPACFTAPPAPAAPGKAWHVVFSEEFNGNDYDHTKLTPCFDWNYGSCTGTFNHGKETYKPEQIRVSNGTAKLVAEPLSPPERNDKCYEGTCTYKSGLLSTARPRADNDSQYLFAFTYGYVEARIKYPAVPGFFTAFWMLPANPTYSYKNEIDIVEILGGHPRDMYMTYSQNYGADKYTLNKFDANGEPQDNGACPVRDYSEDWTRFGVDWQPDHIAWYINGVKCDEFTDAAQIENGPMQLILNMMVDNDWERDAHSVLADQSLVAQLDVDYIRVYQQK